MRFAIFTHVEHVEKWENCSAYAPYVREMNLWLRYVEEVEIVAPLGGDEVKGRRGEQETRRNREKVTGEKGDEVTGGKTGLAYEQSQLTFTEIPSVNFMSFPNAVKAIIQVPSIMMKIFGAMRRADHLHLRCPGHVGLLACICQIFFPSKPKTAKYAGNWDPQAKQPWSYRLQKRILSNTFLTRNMQVLVYGEWPGQSKNILSFFTASFSEKIISEVKDKDFSGSINFLLVGNLVKGKQPLEAVKLVQQLHQHMRNMPAVRLNLYGDGPERKRIEKYCKENGLEDFVQLKGNRSLEELKAAYQKAHFVILPSRSEGWPKAIAEGMFFGCIPIATPVSCVPWMLGFGRRGILLSDEANGPEEWSVVGGQGSVFSGQKSDLNTPTTSQRPTAKGQQPVKSGQCSVVREEISGEQPKAYSLKQEQSGQWSEDSGLDILKITELLADHEEMKRMSNAAKEWSQQYTLERFEAAIKEILEKSNQKSSSLFGRGGGEG